MNSFRLFTASPMVWPLAAALLIASAPPSSAQTTQPKKAAPEQKKPQPAWTVHCANPGNGLKCKAMQTLTLRKTGQQLLQVVISRNPDGKSGVIQLNLPHGMYFPAGVTLQIDKEKPKVLAVQTCDARGCYAGIALPPADLSAMQKGATLAVTFQNLQKKPIKLGVSLNGFTAAYAKLTQ